MFMILPVGLNPWSLLPLSGIFDLPYSLLSHRLQKSILSGTHCQPLALLLSHGTLLPPPTQPNTVLPLREVTGVDGLVKKVHSPFSLSEHCQIERRLGSVVKNSSVLPSLTTSPPTMLI